MTYRFKAQARGKWFVSTALLRGSNVPFVTAQAKHLSVVQTGASIVWTCPTASDYKAFLLAFFSKKASIRWVRLTLPPYTIRGVTQTQHEQLCCVSYHTEGVYIVKSVGHLDYLSVTFPTGFDVNLLSKWVGEWEDVGRGGHGYERAQRSAIGAYAQSYGTQRMGVHVTLKGAELTHLHNKMVMDRDLLNFMRDYDGKPSRLDICVNIINGNISVAELWELWKEKKVKTKSHLAKRYEALPDEGTDDGFYIGSKDSDKFMRVYNKGRQLDTEFDWLRIELQLQKDYAKNMQAALNQNVNIRATINQAILKHCTFDHDVYLLALSETDAVIPEMPRTEPKFWQWITKQVAPAIARRNKQYPEEQVLARLSLALRMAGLEDAEITE